MKSCRRMKSCRWWILLLLTTYQSAAAERPNILFIMADDHTFQAIGAYGRQLAALNPTPNIDSLAANGMRFDQVFCTNSICTPSRATIITGQYCQTHGVLDLSGNIPPEQQYLPTEMKKAGYQTAMVGKWHLKKEPPAFDYYSVLRGQGDYFDPTFFVRGEQAWPKNSVQKKGLHSSDAITDISLEWLKHGRDRSKPFFLMHHFKAPHDMFENAERYESYLAETEIPEPSNLHSPPDGSIASRGFGSGLGREHAPWKLGRKLGIDPQLEERAYAKACYQEFLKRYLRCVKGVDDNVQRLVDYLKETNELDNTVIIYTGDQGFFLGEHDLMDKRWMYEEAMRMPFIVHWPRVVQSGTVNRWLINNADFAPTMLAIAGVATPDYMQGHSFMEALQGQPKPNDWRTETYYRYWMHLAHQLAVPAHFGIRSERYKLIFFYGGTGQVGRRSASLPAGVDRNKGGPVKDVTTPVAWEFYDLQTDPTEMKNEYNNPAYADVIAKMKRQLQATRKALREEDTEAEIVEVISKHWDG